jgi:integrase
MASGKLTARAAATTKPGSHGDGGGLYLIVGSTGARKWVYRFTYAGKIKMMGLGSAEAVSLADARNLRDEARRLLASGINPIEARRAAERTIPTFGALADELLEAKRQEWRSAKHAEQWQVSMTTFAGPLRPMNVDKIDTEAVLSVLTPLWQRAPETASRLRGRIEAVLDAAKARGFRIGENPAAWRGHLEHLLPRRPKIAKRHYAAMPYADVPTLIERLHGDGYIAAVALEFCILTASRSNEVFGARWSEIDMAGKTWVIPAGRMKAGREHRVPLSTRAVEILESLSAAKTSEYVFPSPRSGRQLSHIAMQMVMKRLGVESATVHGFRSSFRDWAGHETSFPREICEQALAHRIGDASELSYKRGDFLEKRRELMEAWGRFCERTRDVNVVAFKKSGGASA